jgi:hypothetical protein
MASDGNNYKQLSRLRDLLAEHFNLEELKMLCFDLGLDIENLPPGGKKLVAQELVDYMRRRGHLPDLVEACEERRPNVAWPQFGKRALGSTTPSPKPEQTATTPSPAPNPFFVGGRINVPEDFFGRGTSR